MLIWFQKYMLTLEVFAWISSFFIIFHILGHLYQLGLSLALVLCQCDFFNSKKLLGKSLLTGDFCYKTLKWLLILQ